jgi:hypothetical protein
MVPRDKEDPVDLGREDREDREGLHLRVDLHLILGITWYVCAVFGLPTVLLSLCHAF